MFIGLHLPNPRKYPVMKPPSKSDKKMNKAAVGSMEMNNRKCRRRNKKLKNEHYQAHRRLCVRREPGPFEYIFYAVLNTDLRMDQGTAAVAIAKGLMSLYSKLENDQVKYQYLDRWTRNGQRILILKGYDHKHLKYLKDEVQFMAIDTHIVRRSVGRSKPIVMLAVFGQREDLEEVFDGLTYLR